MQPDYNSVIKATLTGQIDERIKKLAKKYKQPFPTGYYLSWTSFKGSDPTGRTGAGLAQVKQGQRDMLQAYKCYRAKIKDCLSSLNDEQIYNIKRYLEVAGEPIKGYQRNKAIGHFKEIESAIDDEPLLYE